MGPAAPMARHPAHQDRGGVQITQEIGSAFHGRFTAGPDSFDEQLRGLLGPGPDQGGAVPPGLPDRFHLPGGQGELGAGMGQGNAEIEIGARQGKETPHGAVCGNGAGPDELLDFHRKLPDQSQPAGDPAHGAAELHRQFGQVHAETAGKFSQQPALFQSGLTIRDPHGSHRQECFGRSHVPDQRLDGVLAQPPNGPHPDVSVNEGVLPLRPGHDNDRDLLAMGCHGAQDPLVLSKTPDPQSVIGEGELVEVEVESHGKILERV